MMAELNLDPVAPLKIEPEQTLTQKAGGYLSKAGNYLKKTFWDDPNAKQEEIYQKAQKETSPIKRFLSHAGGYTGEALKNLAAQDYALKNSVGMGAYDALINAASRATKSDAYEKLKSFKKEHQAATDVGNVQGIIASLAMPGGSGYKAGAGVAGKLGLKGAAAGLGKLGAIASGASKLGKGANLLSRVGGAIGKGALLGAEQAIPRGIMEALETGNAGKAAGNAALGVGLGGALGGAGQLVGEGIKGLGKLGSKFAQSQNLMRKSGDVVDPMAKKLKDYVIKGRFPGLNTQAMTKAAKTYARKIGVDPVGYSINAGDEMKDALIGISDKYGIRNTDDLKDLIQGTGKAFEQAYAKTAAAGITPASVLAPAMVDGGEIAQFAAEYGDDAQGVISRIMKNVGDAPDLRTAKSAIDKLVSAYRRNPTPGNMAETEAAGLLYSLKDKLDDAVMEFDPGLAVAKQDWKALAPLRQMVAREELGLASLFSGSPTQEKLAIESAVKGLAAGTGDPVAMAGAAAGSAIGKKAASGLQQAGGFLRGELSEALLKPENLARLKAGIEGVKKIAGGVGKLGGAAVEMAPRVAGAAPSILSQTAEEGPQEAASETDAQAAQVSAQEAAASVAPEQAEEAKQEVNSKWADKVAENVQTAYVEYDVASLGFSYDEFLGAIKKVTNDFEPTISAEIVFPDKSERTAFLKDYERALQYKAVDVSSALTPGGFFPSEGHKTGKAQLTDFVARVAGQDPMLMDKKKKKAIESMINRVSAMKGSQAEKQSALLRELQANYGIDFRRLADLGLLGVA
jgi:hypothetical protein